MNWQELLQQIAQHNIKALARSISLVENDFVSFPGLARALRNPIDWVLKNNNKISTNFQRSIGYA